MTEAISEKRRAENAERKSMGIKTRKAYKKFKKRERRIQREQRNTDAILVDEMEDKQ
jgi:hypothetical protein